MPPATLTSHSAGPYHGAMSASPQGGPAPGRIHWLQRPAVQYALVAAVAATVVFTRLGATTLDDHECKAALAARAMLRPGEWIIAGPKGRPIPPQAIPPNTPLNHWLVPQNNGLPRLVKTPLPYWVMAAVGHLAGGIDEWSARFQSAASAVLVALVVLALGRAMFAPRAALLGALMFATTVGFTKWGRNARPEMMLCLWITVAMACFYAGLSARRTGRRTAWMLAFWAAMGLANLSKQFLPLLLAVPLLAFVVFDHHASRGATAGPGRLSPRRGLASYLLVWSAALAGAIAFQFLRASVSSIPPTVGLAFTALATLVPLAWYALRTGGWRGIVPLLPTALPGVVIMFAAFLPWMWYMKQLFPQAGEVFSEQVAERAAGSPKWAVAAPHYYLLPLMTLTLPWIGFLPGALAAAWADAFRRHRRPLMYLFLWSAGLVGLLTVSAGKREHYILPMIPAVCLLMGFVAEEVLFHHRWLPAGWGRLLGAAYGAAGLVAVGVTAALYFIALKYGPAIAEHVARSARPSRLMLALREPRRWEHMLAVTALAAGPAGMVLAASLRRRLAVAGAAMLAWAAVLLVGFAVGGQLWDDRKPVADFARQVARIAGPDAPLASWGGPQAKIVFYCGRNVPSVTWTRRRLVQEHGKEAGLARWKAWMADRQNVPWLICYGRQAAKVKALGFEVVYQVQGRQKKRLLFTLMRNTGTPRATTKPADHSRARR